jgi:hypothetical protein
MPFNLRLALVGAEWCRLSGKSDPCCYCGDWPTRLYLAEDPPAILFYLCRDCPGHLRNLFGTRLRVVVEQIV